MEVKPRRVTTVRQVVVFWIVTPFNDMVLYERLGGRWRRHSPPKCSYLTTSL